MVVFGETVAASPMFVVWVVIPAAVTVTVVVEGVVVVTVVS